MPLIPSVLEGKFGWGGRTRTSTIRINSAVSYRLDHAPVDSRKILPQSKLAHKGGSESRRNRRAAALARQSITDWRGGVHISGQAPPADCYSFESEHGAAL